MNRANFEALRRQIEQSRFPTSGGNSSLGPGNVARESRPAQVFFCCRIADCLDSNKYYKAYLEDNRFFPLGDKSPEVRVNSSFPLAPKARIWAYAYDRTTGSPDSDDDNYTILRPIGAAGIVLLETGCGGSTSSSSSSDDEESGGGTCTNSSDCYVWNESGVYIPVGTTVWGIPVSGDTSSGKPHFYTFFDKTVSKTIVFHITTAFSGSSTTSFSITQKSDDGFDPTGAGSPVLNNLADSAGGQVFHCGGEGANGIAVLMDNNTLHYQIIQMQCPPATSSSVSSSSSSSVSVHQHHSACVGAAGQLDFTADREPRGGGERR